VRPLTRRGIECVPSESERQHEREQSEFENVNDLLLRFHRLPFAGLSA
jgi:hypothetical protein